MNEKWIWLPEKLYPNDQATRFDALSGGSDESFVVAEFKKEYVFERPIACVKVRFSGDTEVQLFCNGDILATGPCAVGGDFLGNGKAREWYYIGEAERVIEDERIEFFARVKMCPTSIYEYSKGHGGFTLQATVCFTDGSTHMISTDDTWLVRKNGAYVTACTYDGRIMPDPYVNAETVPDIWHAQLAPIPSRSEKEILPGTVTLGPYEEITRKFELDMIYAGYLHLFSKTCGTVKAFLTAREINEERSGGESVILNGDNDEYRSFFLDSAGNITATLKNESPIPAEIGIGFITTCYPVLEEANTVTDDEGINEILSVCKHTLKYCRQTHHLDSPRHTEPLACTGDYYIEALMTAFSFGDMRLAEFDIERTAELLRHNDGRMFHTTYSLIWVRMLYDVYMISGNVDILNKCSDALHLLLARFETYVGDNGLIEDPPDYMFVDWIYIDGISMHHPPKALGQTVLNMFYFMALNYAERIYRQTGDTASEVNCNKKKNVLQQAVNTLLYDSEAGMYFEGLNTPIPDEQVNIWQPQNVEKRYYLKHSNIMAAYTMICDQDTARSLIEKVMNDEIAGNVQPYFQHYLLEAIEKHGLKDKYTLKVIERWKQPVRDCNKGLVEGFYAPEPTYSFDHSHAWGGTPLYSLPKALTGIEVVEAGYKQIRLKPSLLGLKQARVEIPTPKGMIICETEQGSEPKITVPDGIALSDS
jgi:hypothetical protein